MTTLMKMLLFTHFVNTVGKTQCTNALKQKGKLAMEERKEIIYLAGPISDNPDYLVFFADWEKHYTKLGYEVMNPAKLDEKDDPPPWLECLTRCMGYIGLCDVIALLPGWEASFGARIEMMVGVKLHKRFAIPEGSSHECVFRFRALSLNEEEEEDIPWGTEDDLDTAGEDFEDPGNLDDIPGWDK